ncbi:helix-turn-helix domain-containing protein [Streptomyces sp. CA-256286]|uniref:helix-turn-helix domain-containing protein n=1 Tax=Streptomyces sp. CA-256286 TaxID=2801033 RepID=UPI001A9A0B02|nr:helix-turn-helix transcriptional regulator [Streptomyces sp. CA-256286]QTA36834.1 Helix-turn-helix domain protein [Streptomyces sp. CA-256286]
MTFLENILAGLVVAVLSWGVHRLRTWVVRRPVAHPTQKSEPSSLTKHGDLTLNDLPTGPKRELAELLRSLRSESGLTLQAVGDQAQLSKAAVHKILGGRDLANKPNTLRTGSVLALHAVQARPHLDRAGQEKALTFYDQQIRALYTKAVTEDAGPHPAEAAALDLWNQIARGAGPNFPSQFPDDAWEAIERSRLTTVRFMPSRTVGLFIEAPDNDSFWALTDSSLSRDGISWKEEFARSLSRMIDKLVDVLPLCVSDYDEEVEDEH